MALVDRMKQWREAQRRKHGGMVQLTTWVPRRSAEYLKEVFTRLSEPSERGEDYRFAVSRWLQRRRVPGRIYKGIDYSAEIDLPYLGPQWYMRPIGGRVTRGYDVWIELTPDEADEVEFLCSTTVSKALSGWLRERDLHGKVRDHTGVALDPDFVNPNYKLREGDSLMRPESDTAFEENEGRIARAHRDAALRSRKHPTEDPSVVEYEGFHNIPSRCHVVHRREGDRVLFAFGAIEHGGTSPTNMIEQLATRMRLQFYPDVPADCIEWFDCWPETYSLTNHFHVARVHLQSDTRGRYSNPEWEQAPSDVPADFVTEVKRVITPKPVAAPAVTS